MAESTWRTLKYYKYQNILLLRLPFINPSINITIIKCSKCYIYKPRLSFIKDGPLKKLLKLY